MVGELGIFGGHFDVATAGCGGTFGSGSADHWGISIVDRLLISSEVLSATAAGGGAAVGSGRAGFAGQSIVNTLKILSGRITARVDGGGTGIGAGRAHDWGLSSVKDVMITNASINIYVCGDGTAIGSGRADNGGRSSVSNISVLNSVTAAVCGTSRVIGPGRAHHRGESAVDNVVVRNGVVEMSARVGGGGIGAGRDAEVVINASGGGNAASGMANAIDARSITLANCSMRVTTDAARVFSSAPAMNGAVALAFLYRDWASWSMERIDDRGAIEVGNLRFPAATVWDIVVSSGTSSKSLSVDAAAVRRMFLTVDAARNYSAFAQGSARLVDRGGGGTFAVGAAPLFIDELHVAPRRQNRTATAAPTPSEAVGQHIGGVKLSLSELFLIGLAALFLLVVASTIVLSQCANRRRRTTPSRPLNAPLQTASDSPEFAAPAL
jgi:hypothetical protein